MGWSNDGESKNTRSRVVRLRFARKLAGVEDIRLKGVDKFSVVTFEMVRNFLWSWTGVAASHAPPQSLDCKSS